MRGRYSRNEMTGKERRGKEREGDGGREKERVRKKEKGKTK